MSIKVHETFLSNATVTAGTTSLNRVFNIEATEAINEYQAVTASGLPKIGDSHPSLSSARVVSLSSEQMNDTDRRYWRVTVAYNYEFGSGDPTDKRPEVTYGKAEYQVPVDTVYKLAYQKLNSAFALSDAETPEIDFVNSAGDKYSEPLTEVKSNLILNITVYVSEKSFEPEFQVLYLNSINRSKTRIAGVNVLPGQAKIINITPTPSFYTDPNTEEEIKYWTVKYQVLVKDDFHYRRVANVGFNYLNADGDKERFTTENKEKEVVENPDPQWLKADGKEYESGDKIYIWAQTNKALDWEVLSFPKEAFN